jgi:hypothetical protein
VAKGFDAKDIRKEMFPVYGGKFYRVKRFTTGCETFRYDEEIKTEVQK